MALIAIGVMLTLGFLRLWIATYPDASDSNNLAYVLWKQGLNSAMDLDIAVSTMTHDTGSEKRVIGLTATQLNARFGYIRTYDEVSPYLQLCATSNGTEVHDNLPVVHDVLFLRNSNYMVRMKNGLTVDLVLCKG